MSALHAEPPRLAPFRTGVRIPRPRCSVCADTMIAPEDSVFKTDGQVSYLWNWMLAAIVS